MSCGRAAEEAGAGVGGRTTGAAEERRGSTEPEVRAGEETGAEREEGAVIR